MIDIEKFICSLLADHPEGVAVRGDIHRALKEQGLEYKDGKIVPIEDKTELKESDERIRKGIIRNLEYLLDRAEGFVKDELKERIAWLKKQGENSPLKEGTFVNVDEVREDFIQEVYRVLDADPTNDRANQIIDAFDNLSTTSIQKPAEWSKEDEKIMSTIMKEGDLKPSERKWFKSLKYRMQSKQSNKPQGKTASETIKEENVDNANKVEPKFKVGD